MDKSQQVLFARLLCSSQLSHFGDVMVFISRPVERVGGPPESLHRGSENKGSIQQCQPEKPAVMSRRPRTQTHVMTQNTTCLESDQLLLLIITVGGLSVSRQKMNAVRGTAVRTQFYLQKHCSGSQALQEVSAGGLFRANDKKQVSSRSFLGGFRPCFFMLSLKRRVN